MCAILCDVCYIVYLVDILHDGAYFVAEDIGPLHASQGTVGGEVFGGDVTVAANVVDDGVEILDLCTAEILGLDELGETPDGHLTVEALDAADEDGDVAEDAVTTVGAILLFGSQLLPQDALQLAEV